eukprot:Gb_37950 [translate_table: standard]
MIRDEETSSTWFLQAMAFSSSLLASSAALILLLPICNGYQSPPWETTVVTGSVKCHDCSEQRLDKRLALSGASVAINCKTGQEVSTRGVGIIDETGSFSVKLPSSVLNEKGELGQPCFAKLVSGNKKLCSFTNSAPSKLVFATEEGKKNVLTTSDELSFSSLSCNSEATLAKGFPPLSKVPPKPKLPLSPKPKPLPKPKYLPSPIPKPKANTSPFPATTRTTFTNPTPSEVGNMLYPTLDFPPLPPFDLPSGVPFPFIPIINTKYNP